jgi:hypothetical protein
VKVALMTETTHNPFNETHRVSCLRENLTSSSDGEGLETGRALSSVPRQSLTRQTLFYIGAETTATSIPRAWTEQAAVCASLHMMSVERRIGLGLLSGSLLKAIAAMGEGLARGPWDNKPPPSAGRLANHLEIHIENLSALALEGVETRNYRKNPKDAQAQDL